jgi:hypothetical protein
MPTTATAGRLARAHRSAQVLVETGPCRDTAAWLHFLARLEAFAPAGDASLIVEALPWPWRVETLRWKWGHPRCHFVPLPKRAAWLNRSAGCWKILRQRALAGRAGPSIALIDQALQAGVADWNQQPTPFLWGRPPKPQRRLQCCHTYRI